MARCDSNHNSAVGWTDEVQQKTNLKEVLSAPIFARLHGHHRHALPHHGRQLALNPGLRANKDRSPWTGPTSSRIDYWLARLFHLLAHLFSFRTHGACRVSQ